MNRPTFGRRLRSALIALTVTAATAGTSVAVADSASAAASCTTRTVITAKSSTASRVVVTWNDYFALQVDVTPTCSDGNTYTAAGTITVQKSINGGSTWTNVTPGYASSAYWSKDGTNWNSRSAVFRAIYRGATDGSGRTYTSSSDSVTVYMIRDTQDVYSQSGSVRGGYKKTFKIAPTASIKGLYVKFQVKSSGVWKGYKRVQVNRYGKVSAVFAGSSAGRVYRMVQPSGRGFAASTYGTWKIILY
jgi:hypothetical protein